MPQTIILADGTDIGREDALASEKNVEVRHRQWQEILQLYFNANGQRPALEQLVAFHVGVEAARVKMSSLADWHRGTFNLAIPMLVLDAADRKTVVDRVLLRCPMPTKCGEAQHPGSVCEKLRCETASYIWMQQHCPDVRIPHLYGFGFLDGPHFSFAGRLSIVRRAVLYVRQVVALWLRRPVPSNYLPVAVPAMTLKTLKTLGTGYMVIEHFNENAFGKKLPLAVHGQRFLDEANMTKMRNLFRGVSRIILALARVPHPRIGAFRFNTTDATICLDGRPTSCDMAILESEGAPRTMTVDRTYDNVDQYVSDLAAFSEAQFRTAPNAAMGTVDCEAQMAAMVFLRAVTHHFIGDTNNESGSKNDLRNGPFLLYMSDDNAANLMVDDEWNVTGMFDLEWMFTAPADVLNTPTWLTWSTTDDIAHDGYNEYCATRRAFMNSFREEEQRTDTRALEAALGADNCGGRTLSSVMEASWSSNRTWFYRSLMTVDAMLHVVKGRIQPLFVSEDPPRAYFSRLWHKDAKDIVAQKLEDREVYEAAVARLFQDTK